MRTMLSAEVYGAEVGSATPSSMCSSPRSKIGGLRPGKPVSRRTDLFIFSRDCSLFLPAFYELAGFHRREPVYRMFYSQKGAQTWRFGAEELFALLPDRSTDQTRELVG